MSRIETVTSVAAVQDNPVHVDVIPWDLISVGPWCDLGWGCYAAPEDFGATGEPDLAHLVATGGPAELTALRPFYPCG